MLAPDRHADGRRNGVVPRRLKNEAKGKNGFAHLFEHVMFTGSGHTPYGAHDRLTGGVGGSRTTEPTSKTGLYSSNTLPSNPSNRLCGSRPTAWAFSWTPWISEAGCPSGIVKNERRQRSGQPARTVWFTIRLDHVVSSDAPVLMGRHRQRVWRTSRPHPKTGRELLQAVLCSPKNAVAGITGAFQPRNGGARSRVFSAFPSWDPQS